MNKTHTFRNAINLVLISVVIAMVSGCTPSWHAKKADRIAYSTLREARKLALPEQNASKTPDNNDDIDISYKPLLPECKDGQTCVLSLNDCIKIALANNLEYQEKKEELYIEALTVANSLHHWSSFGGTLGDGSTVQGQGEISNTNTNATHDDTLTKSASADIGYGFTQKLAHGGILTLGAGLSLATDLLGLDSTDIGTSFNASFAQPLLKGAWYGFAYEEIYRQRRDLLISVFDFERHTQSFCTEIISDYYGVLQQLDRLNNEKENIERLRTALRRTQLQVEGGQATRIDQDQSEKDLFSARIRLLNQQSSYRNQLDNIKIKLGIPVDYNIELDTQELTGLSTAAAAKIPLLDLAAVESETNAALNEYAIQYDKLHGKRNDKVAKQVRQAVLERKRQDIYDEIFASAVDAAAIEAIKISLHTRPDVLRKTAELRDAKKDIDKAANAFLPQLDLELSYSGDADVDNRDIRSVRYKSKTAKVGLNFDYPIDQSDNRDEYRKAHITYSKSRREMLNTAETIARDVRRSYRTLVETKNTYELQVQNLVLARRSQRLASMEQSEGRADARDVLDAEEDLRNAQNGLTSAAINYENARLDFVASLGLLDIDTNGKYTMRKSPQLFTNIEKLYGSVDSALKQAKLNN